MNFNATTLSHGLGGNDSDYMVSGTVRFFFILVHCLFIFLRSAYIVISVTILLSSELAVSVLLASAAGKVHNQSFRPKVSRDLIGRNN